MRSFFGPFGSFYHRDSWEQSRSFANRYASYAVRKGIAWKNDPSNDHTQPRCLLHRLVLTFPDEKDLKNEILQYTIGTHSTVAGLLTHTCLQLAKRPEIWRELHEEVRDVLFDDPEVPDMTNLKTLNNVINEGMPSGAKRRRSVLPSSQVNLANRITALRLYPSTAFSSRIASCDTILPKGGGVDKKDRLVVPKGATIHANIFALHRDSAIYGAEPYEFNPGRWDHIKPDPWEFMPFSRGRRVCLGKQKGLREAKYMLFRLAQEFSNIRACASTTFAESSNGIPVSCRLVLVPTKEKS